MSETEKIKPVSDREAQVEQDKIRIAMAIERFGNAAARLPGSLPEKRSARVIEALDQFVDRFTAVIPPDGSSMNAPEADLLAQDLGSARFGPDDRGNGRIHDPVDRS